MTSGSNQLDGLPLLVIRRYIGRRLAEFRERAGLTQQQAAKRLDRGRTTIIRIEEGAHNVRLRELEVSGMLDLYKVGWKEQSVIHALAARVREEKSTHLSASYGLFMVLESSAVEIREYETELVPGLLQTREYAELIHRSPLGIATEDQIQERVHIRMERQKLLTRNSPPPPNVDYILGESPLRQAMEWEDSEIVKRQLEHLLNVGRLENVSIRIIPWTVGMHAGISVGTPFQLMQFPTDPSGEQPLEPTTAYVDALDGGRLINEPETVQLYELIWDDIDKKTLSTAESRNLMQSILEDC